MLFLSLGCLQSPLLDDAAELSTLGPNADVTSQADTAEVVAEGAAPGVLLIVLDDLGYGDTSIPALTEFIQASDGEWEPDIATPSMEVFAAQGISLTAFRSAAPVCAPTRAALMTGLQPHYAGFWSANTDMFGAENQLGLRPGLVLLPELLSEAGFSTAMVGKWHLGENEQPWDPSGSDGDCLAPDTPDTRGFDEVFGFLGATHKYSLDEECGELVAGGASQGLTALGDSGCLHAGEHTTEVFTEQAIDQLAALQAGEDPWFLYVAYNAPHTPVDDGADWIRDAASSDHPDAAAYAVMVDACEAPENRSLEMGGSDFCLLVSHLDLHLGRLLAEAPDDALVIVMSDNGGQEGTGASNAHFRGTKGNVFNGGTVVPMMLRSPSIAADTVLDTGVATTDVFATILDFADVDLPQVQSVSDFPNSCVLSVQAEEIPIDGDSLLPLMRGSELSPWTERFQENEGHIALIWQDWENEEHWKLMTGLVHPDNDLPRCEPNWQLYDQWSNVVEDDNLFGAETALVDEMMAALGTQLSSLPYSHESIAWHTCCFAQGRKNCEESCGECSNED
jgi:arylsulfatase A-like enzyme